MATKKKSRKKSKRTAAKVQPKKKPAGKAKSSGKSAKPARKRPAQKKSAQTKSVAATKGLGAKATGGKTPRAGTDAPRRKQPARAGSAFSRDLTGPGSAGQSGDTQGLSGTGEATSESVLELAEEGQAFEAGIVAGIENAPDADAGPIRTREVPEDDVPREYDEEEPGDQR